MPESTWTPRPGRVGEGQLSSAEATARLARRVSRSLTEAGLSLHQRRHGRRRHAPGGVCLLQLPPHAGEHEAGAMVTWTTHKHLLHDGSRDGAYSTLIRVMNETPGTVLRALGYDIEPLGTGGAWLVTAEQDAGGEVNRR